MAIAKILDKKGEMKFNELHRAVVSRVAKKNEKDLKRAKLLLQILPSRQVFWSHIKRLVDQKKLERREEKDRQYVYYSLTTKTKIEVELEMFEGAKPEGQEETQAIENKRIYLLSLILAVFGSERIKRFIPAKPIPGTAVMPHPDGKGHLSVIYDTLPGVGASDFFVKPKSLGLKTKRKVRYSYSHPGIGGLFGYLQASSKLQTRQRLETLERTYPYLIEPFEYNRELRYKIKVPVVHELLTYCLTTLSMVKSRMELTWKYIKKPSPKSGEVKWYELLQGKKEMMAFFLKAKQEREGLSKEAFNVVKSNTNDVIRKYDNGIKYWYQRLTGSDYENIPEKFVLFKEELLKEIVFPRFLIQELHIESKI